MKKVLIASDRAGFHGKEFIKKTLAARAIQQAKQNEPGQAPAMVPVPPDSG